MVLTFPPINRDWLKKAIKRFAAPFTGIPFDHVETNPLIIAHAAKFFGHSTREFWENPEWGITLTAYCHEAYDCLPVTHWYFSNYWVEELGGKLVYSDFLPPIVEDPPIKTPEDVEKIEVPTPEELEKMGTLEKHHRALDYVISHDEIAEMSIPLTYMICPVSIAGAAVDPARLLIWMVKDRELCHKLLQKITDLCANGSIATVNRYGSAEIVTGAVLANNEVLPTKKIEEFAYPYVRDYVRKSLKAGAGRGIYYHLCGDHSQDYTIWQNNIITPFTVMQIGYYGKQPFPARLLKESFGDICTILAPVDTVLMHQGTPLEVYNAGKKQILEGKDSARGFIIGCACEVPTVTPPANIHALVKAAEDFGKYDE